MIKNLILKTKESIYDVYSNFIVKNISRKKWKAKDRGGQRSKYFEEKERKAKDLEGKGQNILKKKKGKRKIWRAKYIQNILKKKKKGS